MGILSFAKGLYEDVKKGLGIETTGVTEGGVRKEVTTVNKSQLLQTLSAPLASVPAVATKSGQIASKVTSSAAGLTKNAWNALKPTTKLAVAATASSVGIVATKSPKLQKQILSAPVNTVDFLQKTGEIYENPSLSKGKELVTSHPIITSALLAGGVGLVGGKAANLATTALNTSAIRENTKSAVSSGQNIIAANPVSSKNDVEIAKIQAQAQLDMAKEQAKLAREQMKAELELAKAQVKATEQKAVVPQTLADSTPTPTSAVPATKKKSKKKKKSTKKKKKKAPAKKKKAKTIKRSKKKRSKNGRRNRRKR